MSEALIDVVNFNADASCLSSARWLDVLQGGKASALHRWLQLYVVHDKKVTLGFPGATLADIVAYNPEAVALINAHPGVFEIVLRPFAHDIGLLRGNTGFQLNLRYGLAAARKEFKRVTLYYLPPEFMCTAHQIGLLEQAGVLGTFVDPSRLDAQTARRVPEQPYRVAGTFGKALTCLPVDPGMTDAYLDSIHVFSADPWNRSVQARRGKVVFAWRDGESTFLLPESVERESAWLQAETPDAPRRHLSELDLATASARVVPQAPMLTAYPIQSFSAWMREMKMYWYVDALRRWEDRLDSLSRAQRFLWLLAINSDILSSVEKTSPVIQARASRGRDPEPLTLHRAEKGTEGEEYLHMLGHFDDPETQEYLRSSDRPHMRKLRARLKYLEALEGGSR